MSRTFSKLKELSQQRSALASSPQAVPEAPGISIEQAIPEVSSPSKIRYFPVFLVVALAAVFILGSLSSNVGTIKNSIFLSMDANIQQQQSQILILNKKLLAMQSLLDERIKKDEAMTNALNKGMQAKLSDIDNTLEGKFDGLNNSVKSKLDQTSTNVDHMEAVLQANIDELNAKIKKLQASQPVPPRTGDQTEVVTAN